MKKHKDLLVTLLKSLSLSRKTMNFLPQSKFGVFYKVDRSGSAKPRREREELVGVRELW